MAYLGTKPANQVIDSTLIADGTVTPADLSTGKPVWDTNGNVGIGVTAPSQPLIVRTDTDFVIGLGKTSAGTGARVGAYNAAINAYKDLVIDGATLNFAVSGGSPSMRIDASGRVTTPSQPYVLATPPGGFTVPANAETTVTGTWNKATDINNNFNTNGTFTAPVAGVYYVTWAVFFNASSAHRLDVYILKNGTIFFRSEQQKWSTNSYNNSSQVSTAVQLAANDNLTFGVYSSSATTLFGSGQPWQYLTISLLG